MYKLISSPRKVSRSRPAAFDLPWPRSMASRQYGRTMRDNGG